MDRWEPRRYTVEERALMSATDRRLDEELRVHRLYLDMERFERGER